LLLSGKSQIPVYLEAFLNPKKKREGMGEVKKPQSRGVWPTVKPFVNGGASGMLATCVIQPIDMIKVHKCLCFWLLEIF
jgi:hypothetical protein